MRIRTHHLDTQAGTYVGRLQCSADYDCSFDYHGLSDADPRLLFEHWQPP